MPKATANLNSFEGGVNRNADPRDIADNESAILWGWNVSDKGVLRLGGGQAYTTVGPTTDITSVDVTDTMSGHGLGFFSADYNLDVDLQRTDYILLANDESKIHLHPYSADTGEFLPEGVQTYDLGGGSAGKIKYYSADGGMRIYDADFNNTDNVNKIFTPIKIEYFRKASRYITSVRYNLEDLTEDVWESYSLDGSQHLIGSDVTRKSWFFGDSYLDVSNNEWGYGIDPGESDESGFANSVIKEKFVASGDSLQASAVSDFDFYFANFGASHSLLQGGTGFGNTVGIRVGEYSAVDGDIGLRKKWVFYLSFIYDEKQETVPILFRKSNTNDIGVASVLTYDHTTSTKAIKVAPTIAFLGDTNRFGSEDQWWDNSSYFTMADLKTWNKRITGFCIYMSDYLADNYSDRILYLCHEVDMISGAVRTPGLPSEEQSGYMRFNASQHLFGYGAANRGSITLLPGETYQSRVGYNPFGKFYEKFKTAVVINRRTYIGNVATLNINGEVDKVFDDRMVKSPVNLFDTFPEENFVDVAINDGDEIIHLEGFSDRILQYKKRNLYIVNVSQDFEFLEGTYQGLGVRHHTQVCKTPQGVAWINKQGCHFYDGRKVVNLINNKIKVGKEINSPNIFADIESLPHKDIFDNDGIVNGSNLEYPGWTAFMASDYENIVNSDGENVKNSIPSIGYDAVSNKLIIIRNLKTGGEANTSGWVYVYDMVNASWTFHPYAYEANTETGKTNFITNSKRELVLYQNLSLYRWTDVHKERVLLSPSESDNVIPYVLFYKSKDIDFGQPSVRKKIYKVYITYKSSLDTSIKPVYSVNGNRLNMNNSIGYRISGAKTFKLNDLHSGTGLRGTGKEWAQVELKPTDSLEANNIFSFQLILYNQLVNNENFFPNLADFEINDISIVYRTKGIR